MIRIDELACDVEVATCFRVGADVEQWPMILPHYRWVRFHEKRGFADGVVEMAAWRPFGVFNYPTWWKSVMWHDENIPCVHYQHIDGVTRGMVVRWEFERHGSGTLIRIVHEWDGPGWPLIGGIAADWVIGPVFVSGIARRTLIGVAARAQVLAEL
jgi:coenzyme Q-binding protein COQ10